MLDFWLTAFLSILFLVDPPGTVPAFLALTSRYTLERRKKTALVASIASTVLLAGFAAVGTFLFKHLGLTLPAFQIAGGLILFLVALDFLRAKRSTQEEPTDAHDDDVAITPIAIPFLAGPAALSTVTVLMAQAKDTIEAGIVYLAIGTTGIVSFITLRLANPIQRRLGETGIHVLGRVLGLVLAGIAVQFVLDGLAAAKLIAPVR